MNQEKWLSYSSFLQEYFIELGLNKTLAIILNIAISLIIVTLVATLLDIIFR
ncbi:MAG: hypothetical protein ACI917_001428, partial [Patiriisocius sp.]